LLPFSSACSKFDDKVIDRVAVDGWKDATQLGNQIVGTFDDVVVDGVMVDGMAGGVPSVFGSSLRVLQNGRVQRYLMVAVSALILVYFLKGVV
jgi:hypothetical protein